MDTTVNTTEIETTCPAYGMKWHKFLICFSLWAAAVLNVILGVAAIANGALLYGIVLIGAAAYTIFTRYQLANLKANAYKHLLATQLIVSIANVILLGFDFSTVCSSITAICINHFYYKKREDLFVN